MVRPALLSVSTLTSHSLLSPCTCLLHSPDLGVLNDVFPTKDISPLPSPGSCLVTRSIKEMFVDVRALKIVLDYLR